MRKLTTVSRSGAPAGPNTCTPTIAFVPTRPWNSTPGTATMVSAIPFCGSLGGNSSGIVGTSATTSGSALPLVAAKPIPSRATTTTPMPK